MTDHVGILHGPLHAGSWHRTQVRLPMPQDVLDLGDITTAPRPEMYLPLWLRLWGELGTGTFNISIAR